MECGNCGSKNTYRDLNNNSGNGVLSSFHTEGGSYSIIDDFDFNFSSGEFLNGSEVWHVRICDSCGNYIEKDELIISECDRCSCNSCVGEIEDIK